MMLRSQKPDTDRQYRRCLTGHATVLPNPAPERSHQRQSMLKAEMMTPDDLGQGSPTPQTIIRTVSRPAKSTAQALNSHSSNTPGRRA